MPADAPKLALIAGLFVALAAPAIATPQRSTPAQPHRAASAAPSGTVSGQAARPGTVAPDARPSAGVNNTAGSGQQGAKPAEGDGRGLAGLPPKWIDKLRDMSPEEQERFLRNFRRFQKLPPQRQEQILRYLQKWNNLSPTEKNAMRDREMLWERMSPEQKKYVQNDLVPKWQAMAPERRQLINGRLHVLQGMTPQQQQEALKDPRFLQGLSGEEQSMLREVYALRNPQP